MMLNTLASELCKAGDYKNQLELKYPPAEELCRSCFQSWIDAEAEPCLRRFDVAGQLDKDVNQPNAWLESIELAKKTLGQLLAQGNTIKGRRSTQTAD